VKNLAFAIFAAAALTLSSAPAAAQFQGDDGLNFVEAVRKADGDKAQELLAKNPRGLVDFRATDGQTALILAIARGDEQWTAFLLNKGADPNLPGKAGDTPLINAARVGFESGVEWLLQLGAKVDADNKMGETALIVAVQQRQPRVAQMLLEAGANPDKTDHAAGYSARDYAQRDPRARDILKLIEAKKPKAAAAAAAK
jgi:ankyrin repeat protein